MNDDERRKSPRHEIEINVTVSKKNEKFPAAMINISKGGVGLVSDRKISPGEKVHITLNYAGDHVIQGTTRWEKLTTKEGRVIYRVGIEADRVLAQEALWKSVLPGSDK